VPGAAGGGGGAPVLRPLWLLRATPRPTSGAHRHFPPNSSISGAMRHPAAHTGAYVQNQLTIWRPAPDHLNPQPGPRLQTLKCLSPDCPVCQAQSGLGVARQSRARSGCCAPPPPNIWRSPPLSAQFKHYWRYAPPRRPHWRLRLKPADDLAPGARSPQSSTRVKASNASAQTVRCAHRPLAGGGAPVLRPLWSLRATSTQHLAPTATLRPIQALLALGATPPPTLAPTFKTSCRSGARRQITSILNPQSWLNPNTPQRPAPWRHPWAPTSGSNPSTPHTAPPSVHAHTRPPPPNLPLTRRPTKNRRRLSSRRRPF
jgi:hypothetical protein